MTEDETVEWHHQLDGDEFEQAPKVGDSKCCAAIYGEELDMTERLTTLNLSLFSQRLYSG